MSDGDGFGTVAIAGLGLIGGSLARDLTARGARVLGHDHDRAAVEQALGDGAIAGVPGEDGDWEEAEVFVLAVPIGAAAAVLEDVLPRLPRARLITDVASTKASIVAAARRLEAGGRFVGAHPLAGDTGSGWSASRAGLFAGARVYLTPSDESSPEAVALARALWTAAGGEIVEMDAGEHDRLLAWTSHLPQVLSSAFAAALAGRGIAHGALGPGGRGVARLAASPPALWRGILADNAASVAQAIGAVERELASIRSALERGDAEAVRGWMEGGRAWGAG